MHNNECFLFRNRKTNERQSKHLFQYCRRGRIETFRYPLNHEKQYVHRYFTIFARLICVIYFGSGGYVNFVKVLHFSSSRKRVVKSITMKNILHILQAIGKKIVCNCFHEIYSLESTISVHDIENKYLGFVQLLW